MNRWKNPLTMEFWEQFHRNFRGFRIEIVARINKVVENPGSILLTRKGHLQVQLNPDRICEMEYRTPCGLDYRPLMAVVKNGNQFYPKTRAVRINPKGHIYRDTEGKWSIGIIAYDEPKVKPDIDEGDVCLYTRSGEVENAQTGAAANNHLLHLTYKDRGFNLKCQDAVVSLGSSLIGEGYYRIDGGKLLVGVAKGAESDETAGVKYKALEAAMKRLEDAFNAHFHPSMGAFPEPKITIDISEAKSNKVFFD